MSDKMREEFEAWANESGYKINLDGGDFVICALWDAWKASRAALCVELPRIGVLHHTTTYCAPNIRSALEVAGVRYK